MRKYVLVGLLLIVVSSAYAAQLVSIAPLTIQIKSSTTTITGTAAKVPGTSLAGRENIALFNSTSATENVWCGASDVTSANGWPLNKTSPAISLDLDDSVDIWCVSDGSSTDIRSLETK